MSNARPRGSSPKGFTPKAPVGTSTQKRDLENNGEKEGSITPKSSESTEANKQTLEIQGDEEQAIEHSEEKKVDEEKIVEEVSLMSKMVAVAKSNQVVENGSISRVGKDATLPEDKIALEGSQNDGLENDGIVKEKSISIDERKTEDDSLQIKLKLEMNEKLRKQEIDRLAEEKIRKQEIEILAEENFSKGNKLFVYPQMVKADEDIEVFLNRSLSTLSDEPDILIMGAFNDWSWKSFTFRLSKTHLEGDWWSCQVHVPKEAYKMDFVFFNGQDVYDNNDTKDFYILVEGGMDASAFYDFLLEEKHRELEKLAKEQAEKERLAEEQRRREAEKAASEADRAQARAEIEKRRGTLQELMKKAASSFNNVWHVEPSEFKGEDLIKLYYNKSSGPLAQANDLWIHGGHNNWKDGLSIVERLVSSDRKDGDWWYANGMLEYIFFNVVMVLSFPLQCLLSLMVTQTICF
ncbi:STARCH SYNTHASE 3 CHLOROPLASTIC/AMYLOPLASTIC [Salix purpurea]|uniref:starch synthase n=1 Tax=Salix purpurea TaxID=77065 RepID=A0A9Q0WHG8_SALPP|nr:STARCH SYNTHASE 3 CHLOROPLASTIC/AMYLOPLASTIC [Salix purpurea]